MSPQTSFGTRLLIGATDLTTTALDSTNVPTEESLESGQVLFAIDRIALTANNITYAAAGNNFGYWSFFPAPDGYGIVPVWGFAYVVASKAEGIHAGERFYGYWPLASHVVCNTADISPAGFADPSPHRQKLGPFYNRYMRTAADAGYDARSENMQAIFRPLFTTAFLIDGFLTRADFFGATRVIISSASSKTALALAFNLHMNHAGSIEIVGLTSPANLEFVRGLGSYDEVLTYDSINTLDAAVPTVFVDFSGNRAIIHPVHAHFGAALKHSATVGMTNWNAMGDQAEKLPGVAPELFFAPSVAEAQIKAMGPQGFGIALGKAWAAFTPHADQHLQISEHSGMNAAQTEFQQLVKNLTPPTMGIILTLQA
jgi:hypothetical protein